MCCCRQQKIQKNVPFFIFVFQELQNSVPCLLTRISFFYIKFANFCYITCSVLDLIPIWSWVHGLTWKTEYSKSSKILLYTDDNKSKYYSNTKDTKWLNLQKTFMKNSTPSKLPQLLLQSFVAKFLTERKYLMNILIFMRRKCFWMFQKIYKIWNK